MKSYKQYIGMATAVAMLLVVGCQREEITDSNEHGTGKLQFSPNLSEATTATRAGESNNGVLQTASAAGVNPPHIVIETYTGTPGSSLKKYFSDELGYFDSGNWDVNSGKPRFLPAGGMHLYGYFATDYTATGDLSNVEYTAPVADTYYPKLTFTVAADDALNQVDLIAAKVENITQSNVVIPFRHILSQINFGVKGIDLHQITIKNIRINEVKGEGTFDYNSWEWTPDTKSNIHTYPYYFPDHKKGDATSGLGDKYSTQGSSDDSQNSYFFGDGGKFGPGKDATFLYAQPTPAYATKENTTTPLNNSLMLLPQEITKNDVATVTFDYEITNQGTVVRSGTNSTVRLDAYYNWDPNMRYVYVFKFDDPQKVTFDVLIEPWIESPGNIETGELNGVTLFEKYVRTMKDGGSYNVPLGALSSDFVCDWSLYSLDNSFTAVSQTFSLTFESPLSFVSGKGVVIKPPFGFKTSTSRLTTPGTITFTPIHPYYTTSNEVNAAITGSGNYMFSVHENVKLSEIQFTGSNTAERSLALRYLAPYNEALPGDRWSKYDQNTVVCFPNDYALIKNSVPYFYTIYNTTGLKAVFDWMNTDGIDNPGGSNKTATYAERMITHINLVQVGSYNLADVYANATNGKLAFVPIGNNTSPYSGTFDGKGATVDNLHIHTGWTETGIGFFGNVSGTVQHLNLTNVSITSGDWQTGGLIGVNNGTVQGCSVQGTIEGTSGPTGGITGQNKAFIYACSSAATLNSTGTDVGGVAGYNEGQVWSCYATNGQNVVGRNENTVLTSYYVAPLDIGTNPEGVTRLSSIAMLNGRIPQLNETIKEVPAHFVSGNLNATPPSIAIGNPAIRQNGGVLKGTFIQNWFAIGWDQNRWNAEMALLATVGMEYLVIDQVMEFSDYDPDNQKYMSWYQASSSVLINDALPISPNPSALEYCMKACRTHGIKLFIGTFFDKRYWDKGVAVKGKETEWKNCITTANLVMNELITKYFHGGNNNYNDVLAGWYFPYEVDDLSFQTPEAQKILQAGIKSAMDYRNTLSEAVRKPYLFSPFMNGKGSGVTGTMDATTYAALWRDIIAETNFKSGDILSPQDCIGVGKLTIGELATWMPALKGATSAVAGVEFWINVETFGPGGNASFLTGQQIPASNPYAAKLISFSYPIYYSPNSDAIYRQGDHDAYKAYYDAQ